LVNSAHPLQLTVPPGISIFYDVRYLATTVQAGIVLAP